MPFIWRWLAPLLMRLTNRLLDYRCSQIFWMVSDNELSLLREFAKTPKVAFPSHSTRGSCLRGIEDVELAWRSAWELGNENLFERVHVPSRSWSRWVFCSATCFVKACNYAGPMRGGCTVIRPAPSSGHRTRTSGRQPELVPGYGGVFGAGRRRGSPKPRKRALLEPGPSRSRYGSFSSLIADPEIRQTASLRGLLQGHTVRDGG